MNSLLLNFVIALWVTAITTACIGIFVYWQNPKNKLNKIFAFYSWSIGWWSFCQIWLIACDNRITALIWTRIEQIGVFFIPTFFIHFVITFLGMKNRRFLIRFCYGLSIFFAMLCPTRHMMADAVPKFYVKHFATPGIVYPFAVFFFFIAVVYGLYELFRAYQQSVGARRNQLTYLFWGSLLGYVGGGANFALVFGINIPFLNPFGTYALAIYVTAVAYAIVRHQLMEIEVLVKKTLIFASLFTIILGIFIGITIVTQELIAGGRLLGLVISSIVIILTVRPLEDLLVRVTDKYLFQKKYDYKQVLKSFIDEVITVLSLDRIIESTIELLDKTLHPDTSDMLLFNKYEDKYVSYKALAHNEVLTIDNSAQMVTFLKSTKDTLSIESSGATAISATLKKEMEDLKARLAIPLMLHDDLIGIMLLGKKKSDEEYNKEDLDILTDLARTEAVAIGNAQLFAETAQNERRAAIGTLAAGINHEIGNPLNIINTKMQVYLMSIDRGLYKG
ncbi:MAG: hypothetical protein HQ575_04515, partial [Candidatus Omnitrophica bacterium]|nr:hypothetical protein [Candidatus Omnitrophota bacterium]